MGYNLEDYYGVIDFDQMLGDSFRGRGWSISYEVGGTNFSFADYTIDAKILDRSGNEKTTLTVTKSTDQVTDDTLLLRANASDMPQEEGQYKYYVTATNSSDAEEVFTVIQGKINIKKKTDF